MSDLTLADFHAGHCVGEYACEWAGLTSPNLCPLASDELFTTYRRLVAEWTPPEPQSAESLADDPTAVERAVKILRRLTEGLHPPLQVAPGPFDWNPSWTECAETIIRAAEKGER